MCKLGFFFFNDTATTEIYTLSLHDALPISTGEVRARGVTSAPNAVLPPWLKQELTAILARLPAVTTPEEDRKSTRLNSSHANISYAVFCLKKKKTPSSHTMSISDTPPSFQY